MLTSNCVICGAELTMNMTQLSFATRNKGVGCACMSHEFSKELKQYIQENGGHLPILEALKEGDE